MDEEAAKDLPREVKEIIRLWDRIVPEKWREFRRAEGVFISAHSPGWTMRHDLDKRNKASRKVVRWTEEWFREKGVEIKCSILGMENRLD